MAIIVVSSSSRSAGKTALVCGLIAGLPEFRWNAVKITNHVHGHPMPIWEETETVSASGLRTDTARYLAAGAGRALLAKPPRRAGTGLPDFPLLLNQLWFMLGPSAHIVFESNTIMQFLKPDLCFALQSDLELREGGPRRKPSFHLGVRYAHATAAIADANRMLHEDEKSKPMFHLAALEHISPEMLAWVRWRLHPATHGALIHVVQDVPQLLETGP